jgi:hypothetical protein
MSNKSLKIRTYTRCDARRRHKLGCTMLLRLTAGRQRAACQTNYEPIETSAARACAYGLRHASDHSLRVLELSDRFPRARCLSFSVGCARGCLFAGHVHLDFISMCIYDDDDERERVFRCFHKPPIQSMCVSSLALI